MDRACEHDRLVAQLRPVVVAPGNQRRLHLRPLQDEARLWFVDGERDRLVEQRLVFDHAAGLEPAARGQDHLRLGVVDADRELFRGKPAKHDGVYRADACASEHCDHRFRHHRHVENDAVAFDDAEITQDRNEHLGLG